MWGRRGGRWGMTAPLGLAEVVPREAKGMVGAAVGREIVGKRHEAGEAK